MVTRTSLILGFIFAGTLLFNLTPVNAAQDYNNTLKEKVSLYEDQARADLAPYFRSAGVPYAATPIKFLAFKAEKKLELWAKNKNKWVYVVDFPILAASGGPGPKLKQGDRQVPEGVYKITYLNPTSDYHLSMKINYPDEFDKEVAAIDHRTDLGGDIFMHGSNLSLGCLAMGDRAIEDLFVLVYKVGLGNSSIVIAANDMRTKKPLIAQNHPQWIDKLNHRIMAALETTQ